MRGLLTCFGFVALVALLGGATGRDGLGANERALLDHHEAILRAHLEGDVEGWTAREADEYVVAGRGEVFFPTVEDRRAQREGYLGRTAFSEYRDLQPPVIRVSEDGTLGWLIAQVEAGGTQTSDDGTTEPVHFVCAWIELYEKRDDAWINVGNVSNFRPE